MYWKNKPRNFRRHKSPRYMVDILTIDPLSVKDIPGQWRDDRFDKTGVIA